LSTLRYLILIKNLHLVEIIKTNLLIQDLVARESQQLEEGDKVYAAVKQDFLRRKIDAWNKLQDSVEFLIDSSNAPTPSGKVAPPGVRQLLEKKDGLFRKHM
jgi:DNA-directed RNA polymerase I subunit RPA1